LSILLALSVMANIAMFLMLIGLLAVFATGQRSMLAEGVVREGPSRNRIAMVTVQGIIHGELANDVYRQLKAARQDRRVKGIIVRINSPGGTISASDQIYKEILKYREEVKKPVVAFMQGVAASGGYYASVACEKIVAEPTTVTGSIGVLSGWFVVQQLLEDKLGVLPVTITSGQKKDWPSSFREPAPEELQYMRDKLITPAYERFVEIVAEGRKEMLSPEQVRQLSDGSIYGAQEALEVKLIDEIGYLDRAIGMVKSMAGIDEAEVVEYRKPFSFMDFLSYRKASLPKLDRNLLYELGTPEILYLWSAY
jgi:protease-4